MSAPHPYNDAVLEEEEQDHADHLQQQQPVPVPSVASQFTVPHALVSAPHPPVPPPNPIQPQNRTPTRQIAPPRRTDHTYHDYAQLTPSPHDFPRTKKSSSNFPAKLHRMISDPANAHAIQWQSHGRAWKIIDKELLVDTVIPKYFVQTKFESFTRQLSGWGFKRLHQTGPDYRCYYHECFLRGLPDLTRMMKRVEPNQGKLLPNVEVEPNFYEMDLRDPLASAPSHSHPSDGGLHVLHDYQAGAGEAAGAAAAAVGYPYPHGGPQPNWPPNDVPPYMPPYPYEHFPGQGLPPPPPPPLGGNYPPPPYPHHPNPHAYPYPQMPPPYHGGYPAGAAAMPPQPHPGYPPYQPSRYPNPHNIHMHHPNQYYNQEAPQPQPQHPNYYDAYHNQHAREDEEDDDEHPYAY